MQTIENVKGKKSGPSIRHRQRQQADTTDTRRWASFTGRNLTDRAESYMIDRLIGDLAIPPNSLPFSSCKKKSSLLARNARIGTRLLMDYYYFLINQLLMTISCSFSCKVRRTCGCGQAKAIRGGLFLQTTSDLHWFLC